MMAAVAACKITGPRWLCSYSHITSTCTCPFILSTYSRARYKSSHLGPQQTCHALSHGSHPKSTGRERQEQERLRENSVNVLEWSNPDLNQSEKISREF